MKSNKEMIAQVTAEVEKYQIRQKSKRKKAVTVGIILSVFLCLAVAAGAAAKYAVFSPEWRSQLMESAGNASKAVGVDDFKEKLAASRDKFSKDAEYQVLMHYNEAIEIGVTQTGGDYVFTLDSIVPGQWLRNKIVSGSLADVAALNFEWQVTDAWFAIIEISRTDGQPMTEEDTWFHWNRFVAGYNPWAMNADLEGCGEYSVHEDGKRWTAVVITDMMMFSDHDFVFAPVDPDVQFSPANEYMYADAQGTIELKDTAPETVVLLRCNVPDTFADKQAQEEFMKGKMLTNFNGYTK